MYGVALAGKDREITTSNDAGGWVNQIIDT